MPILQNRFVTTWKLASLACFAPFYFIFAMLSKEWYAQLEVSRKAFDGLLLCSSF
jgi:hypothetical protein